MLIIPGYVEIIDSTKEIVLKSHLHGNIVKITEKEYIEEFRENRSSGFKEINTELVRFLYKHEMLANKKEIYQNIDLVYAALDRHLQITIMPTEKCNFKCIYCYEDFKNGEMDSNLIENIKHFISKKVVTKNFDSLYLNWFGGEPTLCENIIVDLNGYGKQLCEIYDMKFDSNMTTNGYLLNAEKVKQFYDYSITVYQITIDGFRHDENRPLLDGRKTLNKLVDNLIEIQKLPEKYNFKIIIRYNILEKNEDLRWYDKLSEIFKKDNRFSVLIRVVSDFGGENIKNINLLNQGTYKEVLKQHINYATELGLNVENNLIKTPFASLCYASLKNSYIVRSNGRIVKCTLMLDDNKNLIGHANSSVVIDEERNNLWHQSKIEDKCLQCNYILACLNKNCPKNSRAKECIKWVV